MQIVTSHINTDFDALASMVACTCLYPGTRGVLPSHVTAGVRAFLSIHQDLLRIVPRKGFDLETVSSLIVVPGDDIRNDCRISSCSSRI